jgi:hypothetical protein
MIPIILGGVVSPLSLRGDKKNIGDQKKRRGIRELLEQEKNIAIPNIIVL